MQPGYCLIIIIYLFTQNNTDNAVGYAFIKDHKEIEKVQKRATKLVKSISHLPYGERLKKLSLTTLYNRRQRADVLQVFRIIKGIDKLD